MPRNTAKTTGSTTPSTPSKASKPSALKVASTTHFELYFLQRIHGGETDKEVTIEKGSSTKGQSLLPIFGPKDTINKSSYLELLHRVFEHDATIPVTHEGKVPTDIECQRAASAYVTSVLAGFDVPKVAGFPSKWNPDAHRWDPLLQAEFAYGYPLVDSVGEPVDAIVAVGSDTLVVDFIVQIQGTVPEEGEGDT